MKSRTSSSRYASAVLSHVQISLSQISTRMAKLTVSWQSARVVRTREKVSFFFGVMTLLFSALMFGMHPEYVSFSITAVSAAELILQMGAHLIHPHGLVSHPSSLHPIPPASVALFPVRSMLLCYHPQLHLYLDPPFQRCSLCRMLLPLARFTCQCCYHMAKQSRLP